MSALARILAILAILLFFVALVGFAERVILTGSCGVGPAAPGPTQCAELGR